MAIDALREAVRPIGADAILQLLVSTALVAAVLVLARWRGAGLGDDPVKAYVRGLVQVLAMGLLLAAMLSLHAGWAGPILLLMCAAAAGISMKRAGARRAGLFWMAWASIATGTALTVAAMLAMGALEPTIRDLVPVGSIVIATCMRTASLAFERFDREAASGHDAAAPAVQASLIPAIDGMRSLGLVWIPGIMTGLVLAGASPVRAAVLQFVVIAVGFVAAAVTSLSLTRSLSATRVETT